MLCQEVGGEIAVPVTLFLLHIPLGAINPHDEQNWRRHLRSVRD